MIRYKDGYKYQLAEDYEATIKVIPEHDIDTHFIKLDINGHLTIRKGYAWDGPSGPTFDTKTFMRGSLIHDALYQLLREGHLPQEARKSTDEELRRICLEDGMEPLRAWYVYYGVRIGGQRAARYTKPILEAP